MAAKKTTQHRLQPGNQIWRQRKIHGRPSIFETPDELWEAATKYFEWCDDNPLNEERLFAYKGAISSRNIKKLRPYTMGGLCLHMGIALQTFKNYKARSDFMEICNDIETVIYQQKFEGAAAGLLNPVIIARDLGLREQVKVEEEATVIKDKDKRRSRISELMNKMLGEGEPEGDEK